jgi:hypothetical protein
MTMPWGMLAGDRGVRAALPPAREGAAATAVGHRPHREWRVYSRAFCPYDRRCRWSLILADVRGRLSVRGVGQKADTHEVRHRGERVTGSGGRVVVAAALPGAGRLASWGCTDAEPEMSTVAGGNGERSVPEPPRSACWPLSPREPIADREDASRRVISVKVSTRQRPRSVGMQQDDVV